MGLQLSKSSLICLKYSSNSSIEAFSFRRYRAVNDFRGKPSMSGDVVGNRELGEEDDDVVGGSGCSALM